MTDAATPPWPAPTPTDRCPCQSGLTYGECCRPLHLSERLAPTAERLMRSRYSAFVVGDEAYLLATWHPETRPRPGSLGLDPTTRWFRLDILRATGGGPFDTRGTVEFEARYRSDGHAAERLRETSRFVKENRQWFYLTGAQ